MPARAFQPAYSQQHVPSYAPLPLDAVQYGVERAVETRQRADQALDVYTAQQQEILGQLTPQNRAQAAEILQGDQEFLDRLTDPEGGVRYQDMVPLLRRQARQTQGQIRPYLEDSAQMRAFQERVNEMYDKGDLTLSMRNYYDRVMGDYEGLQFDEQGRPQGFRAPQVVRRVDVNKKIEDYMRHIETGNERVLVEEFGADPAFVREIRQRYLSDGDIQGLREMLSRRLLDDPEVEQYLAAEFEAERDLRERTGADPIEFNEFVSGFINPYVAAEAIPRTTERLRSNPRFSSDDFHNMPLTASVMIGSRESEIATPGQYRAQLGELTEMYEGSQERALNELRNLGMEPRYDGDTGRLTVDSPIVNGVDYSQTLNDLNVELGRARRNLLHMQEYDSDVRRQAEKATGLSFEDENEERYADEIQRAYRNWNQPRGTLQMGQGDWIRQRGEDAYEAFRQSGHYKRALERVSPLYKKYVELFHENAKGGHREQPVASLGRQGDQFMENYLKRTNPVLIDGKTRETLYDDDIDFDVRQAEYSGVFTDEGGEIMAAYQVFDEDGMNPRIVLARAPSGVEDYMLRAGLYDEVDKFVFSNIRALSSEPGATSETFLPITSREGEQIGEAGIDVRMLPRADQDPHRGRQYEVHAVGPDGRRAQYLVGSGNDVAAIYRNLFAKLSQSE